MLLSELFNNTYNPTPLFVGEGNILLHKTDGLIVSGNELPLLLPDAKYMSINNSSKPAPHKVLRFLLKINGELVFAHEGPPSGHIPAHWQMTGTPNLLNAKCITAGNVYFDIHGVLQVIDHKSGDFKPPFDSLQFVFPALIQSMIPLAPIIEIHKLTSSGALEKTYSVTATEILAYSDSVAPLYPQNIEIPSPDSLKLSADSNESSFFHSPCQNEPTGDSYSKSP